MQRRYWGYSKEQGWVVRDRNLMATDCPHCASRALRIPRRLRDRLFSFIVPLRRYRCESPECRWEGNLPAPHLQNRSGPVDRPVWQYVQNAHAPTVVPRE